MMETITSFNQGDPEWHKARIGSLGGSSIGKAVAKGEGKVRKQLLYDMVGEILAGEKKEVFKTIYMEEGLKYESQARDLYAFKFDVEVEEIAMFRDGPHKHASPDGIVGTDGMIEIKTVIPSVFVESKLTGKIPTNYRKQMLWGLRISGREWCDYVVFCPYVKDIDPLIVMRLQRDEKEIKELDLGADEFISEMLSMVEAMRK
jgi:putative phage-type endonuclease